MTIKLRLAQRSTVVARVTPRLSGATLVAGDNIDIDRVGNTYTISANTRERLEADRTYYVRTNGSDSNTGLANTAGGAFLTIQKAWDVVAETLDLAGFQVTIQVADGTYTSGLAGNYLPPGCSGPSSVTIQGNTTTPSNCVISTAGNCIFYGSSETSADWGGIHIKGFKVTSSGANGITTSANLVFDNMEFGACATNQIYTYHNAFVITTTPYTVSGNADMHIRAETQSTCAIHAGTITFSNSPAFTTAHVYAAQGAKVFYTNTFVNGNTVTGTRFYCVAGAYIAADGSGTLSYIPGNSVGVIASGGQYDNLPTGGIRYVSGAMVDATYNATAIDYVIEVASISTTRTINLPAASAFTNGRILSVVDISGSTSPTKKVTATPNGAETINGANSVTDLIYSPYGSATLLCTGGSWITLPNDGWSTYTPTITATSGTYTSVSASGRYKQNGKTVHVSVSVSITTNGTAAGALKFTLPVAPKNANWVGVGRENASTGNLLIVFTDGSLGYIQKYDGTYGFADGHNPCVSITYEAA